MLNDILRISHIIGFSLMIGWAAGVLMLSIVAANTKDPRGVEFMWRMILKEDYIFMPATILILLSGIGRIIVARYPLFNTPWLIAHVVLFVVIVGYGIWMSQKFSVPLWRLAEKDVEEGKVSAEAMSLLRKQEDPHEPEAEIYPDLCDPLCDPHPDGRCDGRLDVGCCSFPVPDLQRAG